MTRPRRLALFRGPVLAAVLAVSTACTPKVFPPGPGSFAATIEDGSIIARDGARLPIRTWAPDGPPKAVIIALHGFNDYSNFFSEPGAYFARLGIISYSNELWNGGQYFNSPLLQEQRRNQNSPIAPQRSRFFFDDFLEFGDQYVEWAPFDHPTYGPVEMGGWKKLSRRVNPRFMSMELFHRNMAFTLYIFTNILWPSEYMPYQKPPALYMMKQ